MAEGSLPASPPNSPGFPNNPLPKVFDGFSGLNTHATRPAIEDQEMFICDGWMPIGKSNLRTLWGVGAELYTSPSGLSIAYFAFANISTTPICVVCLSDGSVMQVNTATGATTQIAASGTISSPSSANIGISQWGSKYLVIVAQQTNGYFLWDGKILYQAGTLGPDVNIDSDGFDYTSPPTITAMGGTGTGASFAAVVENGAITSISMVSPGSGYAYTDSVYLSFSGGGSAYETANATAYIASGSIGNIVITNGGAGYTSTSTMTILGGGGTGAAGSITVSGGAVTGTPLSNNGQGYTSPPTIIITDSNNPVAQATATTMPFGVAGTSAEAFQSRMWVANGAKGLFTAPSSASDFGAADGGGEFISNDSFLRIGFSAFKQTNGFMYLLADSSMNYISGVQTSGSPPMTSFTNQNVDPQIGTPWPDTVQVFSRNIVFANSFGVHVSYGGAVTKVSDALDSFFASPSLFSGFYPSSAVAVIFGIHVYMLLLPVIDQVTGQKVNKLLMWDGKKWWTAQQEPTLVQIATQEINSVMTAWGTDGTNIYPIFQQPSSFLTKTVQSKLWDTPGYYFTKISRRVSGLVNYNSASTEPIVLTVDNGITSTQISQSIAPAILTWTNDSDEVVTWVNSADQVVTWQFSGLSVFNFAVAQPGPLLGITAQTTAPDVTIISLTVIEQIQSTNL